MMSPGSVYVHFGTRDLAQKIILEHGTNSVYDFDLIGVEEARILNSKLNMMSSTVSSWVVVEARGMTEEGQNALLKTIEAISVFWGLIFVLPRSVKLLDTFRSRIVVVDEQSHEKHELNQAAIDFIGMTIAERVAYAKANDNPDLLDALEEGRYKGGKGGERSILLAKQLLREGALSTRMAIEHVAYLLST